MIQPPTTTKNVLALILGGGVGSRLHPLTRERAKPAVPFGGKYRLVDIPISNCINSDIRKIYVLTQFNSVSLHRHIFQTYKFDRFSGGYVQILAAEQTPKSMDWYQGTADAVRKQTMEIHTTRADDVLILSGDHLYRMDYRPYVELHRLKEADVTIAVQPVSAQEARRYGILKTDQNGRIVTFAEKPKSDDELKDLVSTPDSDKPYMASMGVYLFTEPFLQWILAEHAEADFGKHIIPRSIECCKVNAFVFDGFWADIGTIRSFYEVNLLLTHPGMPFSFYDEEYPIFTHPRFLPPSRIDDCDLEHVLIAEGCRMHEATVRESVIGVRSIIGHNSRVTRTMMMGADYYDSDDLIDLSGTRHQIPIGIGDGCEIQGAILDKNVRIGKNVIVRPHDPDENEVYPPDSKPGHELYVIKEGIVVIPKNSEIRPGMVI